VRERETEGGGTESGVLPHTRRRIFFRFHFPGWVLRWPFAFSLASCQGYDLNAPIGGERPLHLLVAHAQLHSPKVRPLVAPKALLVAYPLGV
jgi:hypothetical protein